MRYWWGASVAIGALAGSCLALPIDGIVRTCLACAVPALVVALFRRASIAIAGSALTACLFCALYATVSFRAMTLAHEGTTATFEATVLDDELRDGGALLVLHLRDGRRAECFSAERVAAGTTVTVRGRTEPFDAPRNPGESDARILARARRVDLTLAGCTVTARRGIELDVSTARGILLDRARASLAASLGEPAASIAAGELWGERGSLPPALREEFQETGTVHILVTAGLHVGAVAALVAFLLSAFRCSRVTASMVGIGAAFAMLWISGAHLPAERAAAMASVALVARACGRKALSWNTLGIAVAAILCIDPLQVLDASFWLSICCVAALFTIAPPLHRYMRERGLPQVAAEALAATIAAQIGTWPLTAAVFLRVNPYAVIANALIVPTVPCTMAAATLTILANVLHVAPLALLASHSVQWIVVWTQAILGALTQFPGAGTRIAAPPIWAVAAYEVALVSAPPLLRRGASMLAPALLVLAGAWCMAPPAWPDGRVYVDVLDVGQADAILVRTPSGHAMLVDAGGRLERGRDGQAKAEEIGSRVVVPALLHLGVTHVDVCVITHPHGDHVAGFVAVMHDLDCGEILDSGQTYPGKSYNDVLSQARSKHIPILIAHAGMHLNLEREVALDILGPSQPMIEGKDAINDNSIVLRLTYRSFHMLLTGDAGEPAEGRILQRGDDLHADVLKVGHHGSSHSSSEEFLRAAHPRFAIISVGRHNTFGHPASETLQRLQSGGAAIYRTDLYGCVEVTSGGTGPPTVHATC